MVWNTPNIGVTPAAESLGPQVSGLATLIAASMNAAQQSVLAGDADVTLFDLFGLVDGILANPLAFGLTNVTDACAQFTICDPSQFLFWDGIHPTSAGARVISDAMLAAVPGPATLLLLASGLSAVALIARRRRAQNRTQPFRISSAPCRGASMYLCPPHETPGGSPLPPSRSAELRHRSSDRRPSIARYVTRPALTRQVMAAGGVSC